MSEADRYEYENATICAMECSIPQSYLDQLSKLGLWCSPPIQCFGGGVYIYKPVSAGGNSIPDYSPVGLQLIGNVEQPDSDAAKLVLFKSNRVWVVFGMDCSGGMGPADFVDMWDTLDEAVADIKDFYFGDPTRMNAKARYYRDPVGEIERARRENRMPKWPGRGFYSEDNA